MDLDVPVAEHLIASTRGRIRSLTRPEQASRLWGHLRQVLGPIFSLMLMPDHLHLVAAPGLRMLLTRVLAAFTVKFGVRFDIREPEVAHNADIAGRMMRYGFFNPVRARFVDDPWRWQWSTLRDLGGATHPCWTPLDRISAFLGLSPSRAMRALTTLGNHHGTPPRQGAVLIASIEGVRAAVATTLRVPASEVDALPLGRQLMIQACDEVANPTARRLASELNCSVRSVFRHRKPRHSALDAVLLCLGDPRLIDR